MDLSLSWISDFTKVPTGISAKELGHAITLHTAEVEGAHSQKESYENMVIGKVLELKKHPDADRLNLTKVDTGKEQVQIVCGGQNLKEGMLVALALPGAKVRWHGEGDLVEMKLTKIRGEESYGMICAGEEIGLETDNPEGATEVRIKDLSHLNVEPGTPLAEALEKNDIVFDIDNKSLTHRPDLWGHYGFARELSTIFKSDLTPLSEWVPTQAPDSKEAQPMASIENDELCPRFSMAIMDGVEIKPSPQWMQARLEAAGMNAINNIVDITNYVMLELGQPMHAYDRQVVDSDKLVVRYAKEGETLTTLDEQEHALHPEDPIVTDPNGEPLGLAGIKGGLKSGINDETSQVILEAANWHPIKVRRASTRIGLRTDASKRFEKGLDAKMTEVAIHRAIALIKELCPNAKLISEIQNFGSWQEKDLQIELRPKKVRSMLGLNISKARMVEILTKLAFHIEDKENTEDSLMLVSVPSHRATGDVSLEEDLIEEIGRIEGYDQIPEILPALPINLPKENRERRLKHDMRRILAHQLKFIETLNYSFYSKNRLESCGLDEEEHIRVKNYLSKDQTHMRLSLVPNLLEVSRKNEKRFPAQSLFEIGHIYEKSGEYMPKESKSLGLLIRRDKENPFYEMKGAVEAMLSLFQVAFKLLPSRQASPMAHPKMSLDVLVRGKSIGSLYVLHPAAHKAMDLTGEIAIAELNFNALATAAGSEQKFKEPNKFPGMEFDVSVLVPEKKEVGSLLKAIKKADKGKLLSSVKCTNIYRGKNLKEGEKSVSFKLTLQKEDRTLTQEESQVLQSEVFLALETEGGTIPGKELLS